MPSAPKPSLDNNATASEAAKYLKTYPTELHVLRSWILAQPDLNESIGSLHVQLTDIHCNIHEIFDRAQKYNKRHLKVCFEEARELHRRHLCELKQSFINSLEHILYRGFFQLVQELKHNFPPKNNSPQSSETSSRKRARAEVEIEELFADFQGEPSDGFGPEILPHTRPEAGYISLFDVNSDLEKLD